MNAKRRLESAVDECLQEEIVQSLAATISTAVF